MTDLTEVTTPTLADLRKWYELNEQLAQVKAAEAMLRRRIADHFFPNPTEGSKENKFKMAELGDDTGAILQMDHTINRTVLEAELATYKAGMAEEGSNLPQLPLNKLIRYKPELVKAEYTKLTKEERDACDLFLNIKPGMPALEIKIPKRG